MRHALGEVERPDLHRPDAGLQPFGGKLLGARHEAVEIVMEPAVRLALQPEIVGTGHQKSATRSPGRRRCCNPGSGHARRAQSGQPTTHLYHHAGRRRGNPNPITTRNNKSTTTRLALSRLEPSRTPPDHTAGPLRRRHMPEPFRHISPRHQFPDARRLCCSHHQQPPPPNHPQPLTGNPQHPAQRRQNPARLRHIPQKRHHLRLAQQMRQLRAAPRRLIPNQVNQPPKPPR